MSFSDLIIGLFDEVTDTIPDPIKGELKEYWKIGKEFRFQDEAIDLTGYDVGYAANYEHRFYFRESALRHLLPEHIKTIISHKIAHSYLFYTTGVTLDQLRNDKAIRDANEAEAIRLSEEWGYDDKKTREYLNNIELNNRMEMDLKNAHERISQLKRPVYRLLFSCLLTLALTLTVA